MSDLVTPLRVADSFRIGNNVEMVSIVNGGGLWEFDCYEYNHQIILERLNKYEQLQQRIKELEHQVKTAKADAVREASRYVSNLIAEKSGIPTDNQRREILDHKIDTVLAFETYANNLEGK